MSIFTFIIYACIKNFHAILHAISNPETVIPDIHDSKLAVIKQLVLDYSVYKNALNI